MTAVDPTLAARLREAAADFPELPGSDLLPAQRLMGHVLAYGRLRHLTASIVDDHPGESEAYGLAADVVLEHIAAQLAEMLPELAAKPVELVDPHPAGTIVRDRSDALWRRSDEGYWHHQSGFDALRWDGLVREYGPLLVVTAATNPPVVNPYPVGTVVEDRHGTRWRSEESGWARVDGLGWARHGHLVRHNGPITAVTDDAEPATPAELVDEPGPDVTEVYDADGDRWQRDGDVWEMANYGTSCYWPDLRKLHGPITLTPPAKGGEPE